MGKKIFAASAGWAALTTALFSLIGTPHQTWNCLFGGLLATINLIIIFWALKRIFQKKSIALAGSIIVIKYVAIIGIFVIFHTTGWQVDFGFAVGLSSMFPGLAILALGTLRQYNE